MIGGFLEAVKRDLGEFTNVISNDIRTAAANANQTTPTTPGQKVPSKFPLANAKPSVLLTSPTTVRCVITPEEISSYQTWLSDFDVGTYTDKISEYMDDNSEYVAIKEAFQDLVPVELPYKDFWARFFFRIDRATREAERRALLKELTVGGHGVGSPNGQADDDEEEDFSWDVTGEPTAGVASSTPAGARDSGNKSSPTADAATTSSVAPQSTACDSAAAAKTAAQTAEVATLKREVESLRRQLATERSSTSSLQTECTTLGAKVAELEGALSKANNTAATAAETAAKANAALGLKMKEAAELAEKVASLEAQLASGSAAGSQRMAQPIAQPVAAVATAAAPAPTVAPTSGVTAAAPPSTTTAASTDVMPAAPATASTSTFAVAAPSTAAPSVASAAEPTSTPPPPAASVVPPASPSTTPPPSEPPQPPVATVAPKSATMQGVCAGPSSDLPPTKLEGAVGDSSRASAPLPPSAGEGLEGHVGDGGVYATPPSAEPSQPEGAVAPPSAAVRSTAQSGDAAEAPVLSPAPAPTLGDVGEPAAPAVPAAAPAPAPEPTPVSASAKTAPAADEEGGEAGEDEDWGSW